MNETPENKYAVDMEELGRKMGRTPPPPPKTSPDDWGRTPALSIQDAQRRENDPTANFAQTLKAYIRDSVNWKNMPNNEKEALDLIASDLARICTLQDAGPSWQAIHSWVAIGMGR